MKVIYGLKNLKPQNKKSVVTIGIFDGVHTGHSKILKEVLKHAVKDKSIPVVLTFNPHPQKILHGKHYKSTIISLKHRLQLLEESGVKLCVVIKFTRGFAKKSINWFIKYVLVKKLKAAGLIVGPMFKLGEDRLSAKQLKRILKNYGLNFKVISAQKYKGKDISSSLIRHLIASGHLDIASKLLGRKVAIYGRVVGGQKIGRLIGFRTANIDPHHEVIPPSGVYAVRVKLGNKLYKGVLNIGFRPTFGAQKDPSIEAHITGFKGNLYNKPIEVFFMKKIRRERRFESKEALREQIKEDVECVNKLNFSTKSIIIFKDKRIQALLDKIENDNFNGIDKSWVNRLMLAHNMHYRKNSCQGKG